MKESIRMIKNSDELNENNKIVGKNNETYAAKNCIYNIIDKEKKVSLIKGHRRKNRC